MEPASSVPYTSQQATSSPPEKTSIVERVRHLAGSLRKMSQTVIQSQSAFSRLKQWCLLIHRGSFEASCHSRLSDRKLVCNQSGQASTRCDVDLVRLHKRCLLEDCGYTGKVPECRRSCPAARVILSLAK